MEADGTCSSKEVVVLDQSQTRLAPPPSSGPLLLYFKYFSTYVFFALPAADFENLNKGRTKNLDGGPLGNPRAVSSAEKLQQQQKHPL